MGLFSNPDCPKCGRELSVDTDGFEDFYTCFPCRRKAKQEKEEKKNLLKRIEELEKRINL